MKKLFCYLLIAVLIFGTFTGCKKQDTPPSENTGTAQTENKENTIDATEENTENKKAFHVVIVHKDGTTKELSLETEEEYLGAALLNAGVVEAEKNRFGMHIKKSDGEKAVFEEDGAYWAVYVGEEFATKSTDLTPVEKGATYRLVYSTPVLEDPNEPSWYLLNHVYMPIARGQVGTDWDAVSEFFNQHGYETKIDEGTYGIRDPYRGWSSFGGDLTSENGYAELASLYYTIYDGDDDKFRAGVYCRGKNRENPSYRINVNYYNNTFKKVDSLAEVEAYIRSNG